MPYLHWGLEKHLKSDQNLLQAYLYKPNQVEQLQPWDQKTQLNRADHLERTKEWHQLHIRRSLDQYYYNTLHDTEKGDKDQVVSRYQQRHDNRDTQGKVISMVDQLWLWALLGANDRPDTVISCFPSKDYAQSSGNSKDPSNPDHEGLTDVLNNIKLQMLSEPFSVRTPYDLARLIVATCSRAYLKPSHAKKVLQFAEIYEEAIGSVASVSNPLCFRLTLIIPEDAARSGALRPICPVDEPLKKDRAAWKNCETSRRCGEKANAHG